MVFWKIRNNENINDNDTKNIKILMMMILLLMKIIMMTFKMMIIHAIDDSIMVMVMNKDMLKAD